VSRPVALVTGSSKGLGRALARELAGRGWHLVLTARGADALEDAAEELARTTSVTALAGDVADAGHRGRLARVIRTRGRLDLLVNNASTLGPSPRPTLGAYPLAELERVLAVNVLAPLGLVQELLPLLRASAGRVLQVSSDAAREPYEGWGGYGSSKAALDQLSAVLGAEEPGLRVYAVDPGDLRTEMQQLAFPGEDVSDRADPADVAKVLMHLVEGDLPSGRYRATELEASATAAVAAVTR
jgi:NAD(P)-dependent dehydrogenase (short-subunit alcohol dehydrogenase family)